jgi:transposase/CRISPR/Cas system CSM-associated protein Csm2 small subunit
MEKDIGLSREELIEMLKKSEARNAALAAEVSSLRNGAADSKARIAGYEKDLGILRDEKKKAEKKISELSHASDQLRAYGDEEHFLRTVLERYLVANKVLTRELIRQLYANSRSEKTSELAKKGICVSPAADHPSDSPDTVKSETEGRKRGRREGTVDFDCIPGKTETVDTAPSKTPVCESCGVTMDEKGAQEFYKLSYVPGYFRKTRYIVHCYVCPHCGKRSDTSEKAEDAYGLSGCTPSLGAFLAYLSYGAYLPRNRLRDVFAQSGFPLSKTLIVRYCAMTAKVFAPLAARMKEDLRKAHVVHIDETPYNCLVSGNWGSSGPAFCWYPLCARRMRRMTYPLTEKQKEIVDYSDGHGLEEAEARFGISHNQVRYLREKRNRIEREKNPGNSEAVQPAMAFARVECGERTIEVRIGTVAMTITASDLAEVMRRL